MQSVFVITWELTLLLPVVFVLSVYTQVHINYLDLYFSQNLID